MGYQEREPIEAQISELKPRMKSVNISFKVVEKGEVREVTSRADGEQHRVCDTVVGDSTGLVTVPLWDAAIDEVVDEKTLKEIAPYMDIEGVHVAIYEPDGGVADSSMACSACL